ncbi:MAG: CoA pyrophosphatase [Roseiflexaceae bacterium]|nr:CoA pyrophosphatase [Roseiflexaceae bacterium]
MRAPSGQSFRPNGPPAGVSARLGAVLIMLYPDGADLRLPLTIRSQLLPSHQGEVSLPGGRTDPEDTGPAATALRECDEEIGIAPASLQVWGVLPAVYIVPSNFQVTPVVAFSPVLPVWRANPAEVSAVITVSLRELLDPATVVVERWTLRDTLFDVPFFAVAGQKVWGATALILSEFVGRVRAVISARGSGAQTQ